MLGRLGFAGRMMAIVLLSLLVLVAVSATLGFVVNRRDADAEGWARLPERAAAVVDLLDHADARQRALILKAVNSETVVATISSRRPQMGENGPRLPAVEWIMAQFLREVGHREVIAARQTSSPPSRVFSGWAITRLRMYAREPLLVAIALNGGDWLVFETRVEISPSVLGIPPGFFIGVVGALVGIAALLAIAREARPLRDLAASVSRFAADATPRLVPRRGAPEVAALIGSVNEMQTRIASLLRGRTVLLGAVSHDLKTYITRLRLRAEVMSDTEHYAKTVRDLDDMAILLDDALAVARGAIVPERRERVDIVGLLTEVVADRHPARLATGRRSAKPLRVDGDPTSMRRLFGNLIDNAVHHGSRVEVAITAADGHVTVTIDDDGPGIPQAERGNVFEPFYRLDPSRSRATGGSGLGLAIARQIAEAHGGSIAVETSPLGGARMVVGLPCIA